MVDFDDLSREILKAAVWNFQRYLDNNKTNLDTQHRFLTQRAIIQQVWDQVQDQRGYRNKELLARAFRELEDRGWIESREGKQNALLYFPTKLGIERSGEIMIDKKDPVTKETIKQLKIINLGTMTPSSPPNILEDFSAFVNLINEIQVSSLTLWHDKSKNGNFLGITHEGVTFAYFIGQFESASDYWDAQQYGIDKPKDLIEHREVAEIGWPNIYATQSFKKAFGEKESLPPYDPLMVLFQDWKSSGKSAWHFWKISLENGWEGPSQIVQFAFSKDQFRKYLLDQFYNEIGCYKSPVGDYVRTTMFYLSFCPYENKENWLKGYPDFASFYLALQNYRYYDQQKRMNEPRERRSEERSWGNSYQKLPPYDPLVVYDVRKLIHSSPEKTIILGIQELWMTANKNGWKNIDAIKDTLMEKLPEELFDNKRILRHFSTFSEEPEESSYTRKKQRGKKRMREILERIFPWDNITRLAERFATIGPEKAKEIHISLSDEGDLLATMGVSEIPL